MKSLVCNFFYFSLKHSYCTIRTRFPEVNSTTFLQSHSFFRFFYIFEKKTTLTMARWFRSEPMEYISLIVNEDAAHDCLADLGKMGVIQFTDVRHNL